MKPPRIRTKKTDSARDLARTICRRWPTVDRARLVGCSIQQLRNFYDSLEGRTPRLPGMSLWNIWRD